MMSSWSRRVFFLLVLAQLGCAALEPVDPGAGTESPAVRVRRELDDKRGHREALARAAEVAATSRDPAQAEKAVRMTNHALSSGSTLRDLEANADELLAAARPAADVLLEHERCAHVVTVGQLYERAGDVERSVDLYLEGARECRSAPAALHAGWTLRELKRCPEVIPLVKDAWSWAEDGYRVALLDRVHACSNATTLRRNLAFVPDDVREDYFALLRVRACKQDCSAAYGSCASRCNGSEYCEAQCSALANACEAGCH